MKNVKKLLTLIITMFIGVISIKAASIGEITNTSPKAFKFVVSGAKGWVLGYNDFKEYIRCEGDGTTASTNPYGRNINMDSVTIKCDVLKDDYKIIKFNLSDSKNTVTKEWDINSSNKPTTTTVQTTTTPTTTQSKGKDATIKSIDIKGNDNSAVTLSPNFSPNVLKYTSIVAGKIERLNIVPVLNDSKATFVLSSNATKALKEGETTEITITVTAEDGITKNIYTISVKREALSTDATLKSIKIKELPNFKFLNSKESYDIIIPKNVNKLTIDAEASDSESKVSIENNENLKDGEIVRITVTAADGTKKLYKLNIVKEEQKVQKKVQKVNKPKNVEKNPIVIMLLSMIAFSLIGAIIHVIRKK